jgi:hypothetical protein
MSRSERAVAETVWEIALALSEDINVEPNRRHALGSAVANLKQLR